MCTALSLVNNSHYFGRNLDLECSYSEQITIVPRRCPLAFRCMPTIRMHYAMIGTASAHSDYPLYYDAVNEAGLAMAGLNFPGYAHYPPCAKDRDNVAPFELIPWVLSQCKTIAEAKALLERTNLCDIAFSKELPLTPLHFLISDSDDSLAVEPLESGLRLCSNPAGVLTNSPPLDYHLTRLADFMALAEKAPQNTFAPAINLAPYSRGMGAMGLPGDLSSSSRFVRAAFLRAHSVCPDGEMENVSQFFHILSAVSHVRGSVLVDGQQEITQYTSCCNAQTGVYYYTTYENSRITAVDMRKENLDGDAPIVYPMIRETQVLFQNG